MRPGSHAAGNRSPLSRRRRETERPGHHIVTWSSTCEELDGGRIVEVAITPDAIQLGTVSGWTVVAHHSDALSSHNASGSVS